jgi:hypothetical protein
MAGMVHEKHEAMTRDPQPGDALLPVAVICSDMEHYRWRKRQA